MELDITIKGGVELKKFYPAEYEAFMSELSEKIMDTFPGVDGFSIGSELTDRHKADEEGRERIRKEEFGQTLTKVLKEPEFQQILRAHVAGLAGE
jgi:hypothetical protein